MPAESSVIDAPAPTNKALNLPPGVKLGGGESFGAKNFFPPKSDDGAAPVAPAPAKESATPAPAPTPELAPSTSLSDRMAEAAGIRKAEAVKPAESKPAEAKPEVPDADALDFDKVEIDGRVSAKATEAFKMVKAKANAQIAKLREDMTAAQRKAATLEEQLKTAPVGTMTNAEAEAMKAKVKDLSDKLLVTNLAEHPTFRAQFTEPKLNAVTAAGEILSSQKVEGVDIGKLLSLPRADFAKQVSEVAAKLPSFDATEFSSQMRTAYQLQQGETAALSKAHETYDALQKNFKESGVAAFNRTLEKMGGDLTKLMPKAEIPKTATAEQLEEINRYNAAIDSLAPTARQIALESASPDQVAASALKAAAYDFHIQHALPKILGEYQRLQAALVEAQAELKAVRGKNPNNFGFNPPVGATEATQKELENVPKDERIGYLAKKFFPRPGSAR